MIVNLITKNMERKFEIDFFELAFLAEACIPPVPIARSMFWDNLTDVYYEQMTAQDRERLYDWLRRNPKYKESLEKGIDSVDVFEARFNPDNQYELTMDDGSVYNTFKLGGHFWISNNKFAQDERIKTIKKL